MRWKTHLFSHFRLFQIFFSSHRRSHAPDTIIIARQRHSVNNSNTITIGLSAVWIATVFVPNVGSGERADVAKVELWEQRFVEWWKNTHNDSHHVHEVMYIQVPKCRAMQTLLCGIFPTQMKTKLFGKPDDVRYAGFFGEKKSTKNSNLRCITLEVRIYTCRILQTKLFKLNIL